jgi:hypothetical protein
MSHGSPETRNKKIKQISGQAPLQLLNSYATVKNIYQIAFSLRQLFEFGIVLPHTSKGFLSASLSVHEFRERSADVTTLNDGVAAFYDELKSGKAVWMSKKGGSIPAAVIAQTEAKMVSEFEALMKVKPSVEITADNIGEVRVCIVSQFTPASANSKCFFNLYHHKVLDFDPIAPCYSFKIVPPHFLTPPDKQSLQEFTAMLDEAFEKISKSERNKDETYHLRKRF